MLKKDHAEIIHSRDKKVIFEEDMATKIKLNGQNIERDLAKDLRDLEVIRLYKTLTFCRATNKIKKKYEMWSILSFNKS